jgi:hypothetical protein
MFISPDLPYQSTQEGPGSLADFRMMKDDKWLMNTEVRYWIAHRHSQWHLTMVYIATENPLQFICRKIDTYHSEKKAMTFARILQHGIRKDARGTLKIRQDAFNFCEN